MREEQHAERADRAVRGVVGVMAARVVHPITRRRLQRGRPRALDAELDEYVIDALLLNWSRWAAGHAASIGYGNHGGLPPVAPNEDDARALEVILVRMKARRPRLWSAVWYRYVARYTDYGAARAMSKRGRRETPDTVRALMLRAYAWIDGHLAGDLIA